VTDVANAILDGSDAVMLSGETAVGEYPLEAVRMMARVAVRADGCLPDRTVFGETGGPPDVTDAVAQAAVEISRCVRARAIVCATTSGGTARHVAKYRPDAQVIAATPLTETYRRMALSWGVRPVLIGDVRDTDQMMEETICSVLARRMVKAGDRIVLTAGVPVGSVGSTNLIKVHVVGQPVRPAV
jgi:pyruvate kinase